MSDKGDKVCPICTEEMDLTDQQLKPCKCGYEICVWCWNHIMEMAEKDNTEGRCPACRTPYDKEKIVATAAKCERLVAEINSERKQKSQKPKPKASEAKMYLNDFRVIQRNLVYINGLPLNLADEELLQRREYFGQYGKVLKVSLSRTATGAIQQSANNSCSVYITYSKEEDAIRCIQSVHSFVLDGRPLRACFGLTKYCHAWLRNMPCSNSYCLYLHDFGPEEDSFTKDDLVSAFQRSKVQQIIGATNNMHRSGDVLPLPADHGNGTRPSTGRPVDKNPYTIIENQSKGSCTDGGAPESDKSNAFPAIASWITRVSGPVPLATNPPGSVEPHSSKPEISVGLPVPALQAVSTKNSMQDLRTMTKEGICTNQLNGKVDPLERTGEGYNGSSCHIGLSNRAADPISCTSHTDVKVGIQTRPLSASKGIDHTSEATLSRGDQVTTKPFCFADETKNVPAVSNLSHIKFHRSTPIVSNNFVSNHNSFNMSGSRGSVQLQDISGQFEGLSTSLPARETITAENLLKYDDEQTKCLEEELYHQTNPDSNPRVARMNSEKANFPMTTGKTTLSYGINQSLVDMDGTFGYSSMLSEVGLGKYLEGCGKNIGSVDNSVTSDTRESSIISKILSIDFDTWEDSLASPQTLVQLLSDNDKQQGCFNVQRGCKVADSKQSRFSFARHEDFYNPRADECSMSSDLHENKGLRLGNYENIFPSFSPVESDNKVSMFSKHPVLRSPNSTPPGFSVPCRTPPPGFPTHGRMQQQTFDNSARYLLQTSAPRAHSVGSFGDAEFVDPAILEVGQGRQPAWISDPGRDMRLYSSVQHSPNFDSGLQQLMRQSDHQNLTLSRSENQSISPMPLGHYQPSFHSAVTQFTAEPFRNIHMQNEGWYLRNDVKVVGDLGVSDLVSRQGMGINNFRPSYEELRSPMSSSSNVYNRGFAI